MIQIRTSRIQLVIILGFAFTIITLISTLNPFKFDLLAADDPVACENACIAETGDPYGDCYMYCNPGSYGYYDGDCTYVSFMYGESNPELWCSYVDTNAQMCAGGCKDVNWSYFGYETSCTDLCNSYATTADCITQTPIYFDGSADSSFCSLLEYSSGGGGGETGSATFDVTGMPNDYKIVTTTGTQTISGTITEPAGAVDSVQIYSYTTDSTSNCTYNWSSGDDYTFSCTTPSMSTDGTYIYDIKSYSYSVESTKTVYIELGSDLVALWNFDNTTWYNEAISDLTGILGNGATQSTQGHPLNALNGTSGGYINQDDSAENFSFSGDSAHFKVQADVYSSDFATGDKRVVGKYNQADDENTWLLGTYHDGGIYCAIWIDGNQRAINSGATHLTNDQWNTIACEWNASTRTLKGYINDVEVSSSYIDGTGYIMPSTNYLTINGRPGGWDGFNGLVDNVKFYEYPTVIPDNESPAVTVDAQDQFKFLDSTVQTSISGEATDNETVTSVEIKRIGTDTWNTCTLNLPAYTCWTGPMSDLATNGYEIRATDDSGNITSSSEYGSAEIEVDTLGGLTLKSVWRLEDYTDPKDELSFSSNGSFTATPSNTQGLYSGAIDFTGDRRLNISDLTGKYSFYEEGYLPHIRFEGSLKRDYLEGSNKIVIGKTTPDGNNAQWILGAHDTSGVYCSVWTEGGEVWSYTDQHLTVDIWQTVACDWNALTGELKSYINGTEVKSITTDIDISQRGFPISDQPLSIGARSDGRDPFNGQLDHVKVYSEQLEIPFYGDGNPPIIRINPVENADWLTDTTPTITGTITDPDTVLSANYLLFMDRNGYTDEDIDTYTWTDFLPTDGAWDEQTEEFSITLPEVTVENGYYFLVKAKDLAGTESIYLNTGWIISGDNSDYLMAFKKLNFEFEDTTAPIITLNDVVPNPTNKTEVKIKGNVKDYALDTQSAIASIQYKLDSGTWQDAKVIASSDQNRNKDFVVELSNLSIGNHSVEVRATDAQGNLTGEGYDACYDACIPYPNETALSCELRCDRHKQITTKTSSFEVIPTQTVSPELKRETVNFNTSRSVNNSGTTATVGYNRARLPLTYTYDTNFEFYSNSDEFGKLYGDKVLGVNNAIDGNLWLTFNNESFGYYNTTTKQLTRYPTEIYPAVGEITEFEYQGNRYLAITQRGSSPAGIYSIGTTPEDTSDDSHYDYSTLLGVNSTLHTFKRDTRSSTPAFYAIVGNTGSNTAVVLWIDTMGTMSDPSDDTYTLQTQADGLDPNMTAIYFDSVKNWLIMGSYDAYRINYLDDNGTPTNKSDDTIVKSTTDQLLEDAFSITKDSNGRYWIAGNRGVHSIQLNNLSDLPTATYTTYLKTADVGSERPWKLQWVDNTQKKTEEFLVSTREGSIYAYDYNKTYDDLSDDKFARYTFPPELYGSFISYEHTFTPDGNSAWMMMPASGLYKLGITRDYTNSAEVILWPDIDSQDKYIDQFKIESIDGTNLDNIEIFVTNDGGETWIATEIGETTRFTTSDYQVQVKIILNKVGIDSPEVLGVNIAYATYNEDPVNESDLILDYPAQTGVGDAFETDIMLVDELGEIPNWSGDVEVNAYNAVNNSDANNCFDYESQDVEMVSGAATIQTEALCEGDYYFSGTTEDGRSASGSEIKILGTYIPDPELCGNGLLDTGEQCDYTLKETYMCEDGKTEKICTTQCLLDDTDCEEEKDNVITPIINDLKDLVKDGENEDISTSISIAQVANWAIKLISLTLLTLSLPLLPYYIVRFLTGILYLLNAKKRTREYGYVYDSVTKEPISQAIIRYYIGEKLVQTDVTGIYGEFGGDLEPGNYTIVVEKPEYIFPSRLIMGSSDGQIENVYTGTLNITQANETTVAIPMDKINASLIEIFKTAIINRISIGMQILKLVIFLALLAYSIFAYQTNPSILNIIVLIEYVILSVLIFITLLKKDIQYGEVQTIYGDVVRNTKIGVYETEFNKLITQRVTDDKGRYRFILKPGEYRLETLNSNYKLSQETVLKLEDKPSIINRDLTLEPK